MNNFEKVVASPETLGAFMASLPIADGPWDEQFHRQFCEGCKQTCDHCQHKDKRNNPTWWLKLGAAEETNAAKDGRCMDFNVYLGEKASGGLPLEGVEEVHIRMEEEFLDKLHIVADYEGKHGKIELDKKSPWSNYSRDFYIRILHFVYFLLSDTATATATVAPTMGLLPMPRKPIIST